MNSENDIVTEEDLRNEVTSFLRRNFPQIQMHGGSSDIVDVDLESGHVHIVLSGACSGCGISPMTVEAIKQRMSKNIDVVETIEVDVGLDGLGNSPRVNQSKDTGSDDDDDEDSSGEGVKAPF